MGDNPHNQKFPAPWWNVATTAAEECDRFTTGWRTAYATAGGELFCGRGCSGCCSLAVNCTLPEALRLVAVLTTYQRDRLRTHVQRLLQLADVATTLPDWLRAHRRQAGSCPFLAPDGACEVYAHRPLSCRALLATREPRWCSVDFSTLSSNDKQAFMASLDRSIVAFPLHYVAATRQYAEALEQSLLQGMLAQWGVAVYGSLPVLAWLESEYTLSDAVSAGGAAVEQLLAAHGVQSPFLVTISR